VNAPGVRKLPAGETRTHAVAAGCEHDGTRLGEADDAVLGSISVRLRRHMSVCKEGDSVTDLEEI